MFLLVLFCISPDCSGAIATREVPAIMLLDTVEECNEVGKNKAAAWKYWTHYEYDFTCGLSKESLENGRRG